MAAVADLERFLERVFERTSARLFRSRVQAVQVERRVERSMEAGRAGRGASTVVPSRYRVRMHPGDLDDLAVRTGGYEALAARLADRALAFARLHAYHLPTRPVVSVVADPSLERGRVEVDASDGRPAPPSATAAPAPGEAAPDQPGPARNPATVDEGALRDAAGPGAAPAIPEAALPAEASEVPWAPLAPDPFPGQPAAPLTPRVPPDAESVIPGIVPGSAGSEPVIAASRVPSDAAPVEHGLRAPGDRVYDVRPAAPPPSRALLRILEPGGREREVRVDGAPLTLGRAPDNGLVIADARVSRHHGRFQARHGTLVYTDLGSTNGTRVNGIRVDEIVLGPGDQIQVGDAVVVVEHLPG